MLVVGLKTKAMVKLESRLREFFTSLPNLKIKSLLSKPGWRLSEDSRNILVMEQKLA